MNIEYTDEIAISQALEVVRQMSQGQTLGFQGYEIGMSKEGHIGFVEDGDKVSYFSEVTFSDLVKICKKENVIIIPKSGE